MFLSLKMIRIDTRKNQTCPEPAYIKGEAVEKVETYKHFGVHIKVVLEKSERENLDLLESVQMC